MFQNEYNRIKEETRRVLRELRSEPNPDDVNKYRVIYNPDDINKYRVSPKTIIHPIWENRFKV